MFSFKSPFQKRRSPRQWGKGLLAAGLALSLTTGAASNPTGPTVRHGSVNITSGLETQIQQLTDRAIIDWQSFSISTNEAVRFLQPSQLSVILNRVTGQDPSTILGRLQANGNVFLINPNGILFGPTSTVNVGGLVASTLNITDQDFLAGNYSFFQDGTDLAAVVNQGEITVTDGGYAVLTGPSVINEGTIIARSGKVLLAAGERSTLNLDGRDLIHYTLNGEVSEGTVILAPGMMSDAIAQTLGIEGSRRADSLVQMADGSVRMVNSSGTLVQAGTVSADGRAGVDAGAVWLDSADYTLVNGGSLTTASGHGLNSHAGEVVVLSDMAGVTPGQTQVDAGATLAAAGGASGDAGFIEVSGDAVTMHGDLDLSFTAGEGGHFLLDPVDIHIIDGNSGPTAINATLTEVGDGWIESNLNSMDITLGMDGRLVSDVTGSSGGNDTGVQTSGTFTLTYDTSSLSGEDIDLGVDVYNLGGDFLLSAGNGIDLGSSQITAANVDFTADLGDIVGDGFTLDTRGTVGTVADGGTIFLTALDGNVTLDNANLFFDNIFFTGLVIDTTGATGNITLNNTLLQADADTNGTSLAPIQLESGGGIFLSNPVLRGQEIDLTATTPDLNGVGINLGNSQIIGQEVSLQALDGDIVGDGFTIDTRGVVGTQNDGGTVTLTADTGDVDLDNASIFFDEEAGSGLSIDTTGGGNILLDNSLLQSDVILPAGTFFLGPINLNAGNDLTLVDTDLRGLDIDLTGSTVSIDNQDMDVEEIDASGALNISASSFLGAFSTLYGTDIDISADDIDLDFAFLSASTINLTATSGNILVDGIAAFGDSITMSANGAIDGDVETPFGLGIHADQIGAESLTDRVEFVLDSRDGPISLTVDAAGPVSVADQAPTGDATSIELARIGGSPGNPAINSGGSVTLTTQGSILSAPAGTAADIVAGTGEKISLEGFEGVGDFGPDGDIDIEGSNNLLVSAQGADAPVHVTSSEDLEFIELKLNGGEALITDGGGAQLRHSVPTGGSSRVLQLDQNSNPLVNDALVRVVTFSDMLLDNIDVESGQTLLLWAATDSGGNRASFLAGDSTMTSNPNGTETPNISVQSGGLLQIFSEGSVGAVNDYLIVEADEISVSGNDFQSDSDVYLGLQSISTGLTLHGIDSNAFNQTADQYDPMTASFNSASAGGDFIIDIPSDLDLPEGIFAGAVAIEAGGTVNLGSEVNGSDALLIDAFSLNGASSSIGGGAIGLQLDQNLGDASNLVGVTTATSLTLGNTASTSYFLETNTEVDGDVDWVNSVSVGNKTLSGNSASTVHHKNNGGDITISSSLAAGTELFLNSEGPGGNIVQGTNGLLDAQTVVLEAAGNIGDINNDQMVSADFLAAHATGSGYLRDTSGDTELVFDSKLLGTVGAGNEFRVRNDNGDLTISTAVQATDLAFVTGSSLAIPAQATGPGIFVNGNVTATGSLVFLSAGDLSLGTGGSVTADSLGLGAGGGIGTSGSTFAFSANNLAVNGPIDFLAPSSPPTDTPSVTSVGVTVNAQTTPPPSPEPEPEPEPDPPITGESVVVEVVLSPREEIDSSVFAQDNVDLVEQTLSDILNETSILVDPLDPTAPLPLDWYNDEEFLRKKWRLKR